jgi:nucleobase:cation symporter-1, NCS1 family
LAVLNATRWLTSPPGSQELTAERAPGLRSHVTLWAALSMSLLVFVPGAYLVPALRLRDAIAVSVVGSVAGAAVLAAVATVAAQRHRNTVGLIASTLGVPSGPFVAALLLLRHVVWATFTLAFAANIATNVPGLGGSRALWGIAFGALALALALMPVQIFVQRWIGWFSVWVGIVLIALVTLTGATTYGIPILHDADGLGGWPTRAQGFDLIAAMPLLWLPIVADYAYDAGSHRDAGIGAFVGSGTMTAWYAIVGVLWVFTVSAHDVAGFMSALPIGAAAILIVIALQANAVAANLYSASMAGGRFGYRWFRPALIGVAVVAATLVVTTDALRIVDAALLLASIFLPLFAVVLARTILPRAPVAFSWVAWGAGVLAFGWINPGDLTAWRDVMHFIFATVLGAPFPLDGELTRIPATVAAFVVAGGGYLVLAWPLQRRRRS